MRLRQTLLLTAAALAVGCFPAPASAAGGGVAAPEEPFLAIEPSSAGGETAPPASGSDGGTGTADRALIDARRRAAERRARARARRRAAREHREAAAERRRAARERRARKRRRARKPGSGGTEDGGGLAVSEDGHVFPVAGAFDLGGAGSRFGAPRAGHIHQGQDIAAAEGTPVVAPFAGAVEFVRYQRSGAGWYVVLDGDGEDRDYVFMHLVAGSITVEAGDHVSAGQAIGQVGNTGSSSGAHLHFEIWVGGWYDGGAPIDPLPLLREWAGLS